MLTKTVELPGGVLTLKRAKVRDRLLTNVIIGKLGFDTEDSDSYTGMRMFARLVTQAQIEGNGLGFDLPAITDSEEDLRAAFEKFQELDGFYYDEIELALFEVDKPLNDPDLLPAEAVPENLDEAAE